QSRQQGRHETRHQQKRFLPPAQTGPLAPTRQNSRRDDALTVFRFVASSAASPRGAQTFSRCGPESCILQPHVRKLCAHTSTHPAPATSALLRSEPASL